MGGSREALTLEQHQISSIDRPDSRVEASIAADQAREFAAYAELTGNRLQPQITYAPRFAGHLGVGEMAIEPALGPARVAGVAQHDEHATIVWKDDHGLSTAAARYGVEQVFFVRVPGPRDRLTIQQQVDRALWRRGDIPGATARLIAAHLHLGPRSATFRFAIDGAILEDRFYDELEQIKRSRPALAQWVNALAGHCLSRDDTGPVPGWIPDRPEPAMGTQEPEATLTLNGPERRKLLGKYVTRATAEQLIEAAFDLGVLAARTGASKTILGRLARSKRAVTLRRNRSPATDSSTQRLSAPKVSPDTPPP